MFLNVKTLCWAGLRSTLFRISSGLARLGVRYGARLHLYLYLYFDIQRHPHRYNSGYYVEVKDDSEKNYYCKEKDEDKAV